jgi:hypothetical protein
MGQTASHEYAAVTQKKELAEPTFLDVMRQKAIKAEMDSNAAVEAVLVAELTPEKLANSEAAIVEWVIRCIDAYAAKASTSFAITGGVTLFLDTWKKVEPLLIEGKEESKLFDVQLKMHVEAIQKEVAKRTKLVAAKNSSIFLRDGDASCCASSRGKGQFTFYIRY